MAHLFLLPALFLQGCPSSHGGGPPPGCPDIAGSCLDECCGSASDPIGWEECTPVCPAGTAFTDRCLAPPGCGVDAGTCPMPGMLPPPCAAGPCCTEGFGTAVWDCATLAWSCPAGGSPECAPDPGARCAAPYLACDEPTDCVLASAQCCGPCVRTLDNTIAVNGERRDEYFDYDTECAGIDCAACPPPAPDPLRPRLFPTCGPDGLGDLCRAFDVRADPVSECTTDDDCKVRVPGCCECGGATAPELLIAIRRDQEGRFARLVCPHEGSCPACLPDDPGGTRAFCAADGHCAVAIEP